MHTDHQEAMNKAAEAINDVANAPIRGGFILEKIMGPLSTGHLELRSTNPNDNPAVTFNYFKEPEDLERCVQGMSTVIDVINSNAFSKFRYRSMPVQALISLMVSLPVNLRPRHPTAAISLEQFCLDTVMTIWHYHGGCQVGSVVDHDYKVVGVEALRVVDGSTFLGSPGTNPQATVMMLGRYVRNETFDICRAWMFLILFSLCLVAGIWERGFCSKDIPIEGISRSCLI
jgi:choline dehydrogenase